MIHLTVTDRANAIATFRYVHVRLMETVALWTPRTPEMEVKVMFGRHIWDFAQHADSLGRRTFELRQPEQHSRTPVDAYVSLLDGVARASSTAERLGSLYDAIIPGLQRRYRQYVAAADDVLDEPSIVILDRILRDFDRQRAEADSLRRQIGIERFDPASIAGGDQSIERIVA
ncbi:MAG TPA: hypothetical protein VLV78_15795 [Thermoanaerobaculia bacterium]|nr:hypothetical protein [Thermoanaerobaculia bacterium]